MRLQALLVALAALAPSRAMAVGGWEYGDRFFGSAKSACEAHLAEDPHVRYVITDVIPTDAPGGATCWFKNQTDDGAAGTQKVFFKNSRPFDPNSMPLFRGATRATLRAPDPFGDLGPGVYWTTEDWSARSDAIARFLDGAIARPHAEWGALPPGQVVMHVLPSGFLDGSDIRWLDFSQGDERAAFEAFVDANVTRRVLLRAGVTTPSVYRDAVVAWLATTRRRLDDFDLVLAPNYRIPDATQVLVRKPELIAAFAANTSVRYEVRGPSVTDLHDALAAYPGTAKRGACSTWTPGAATRLFVTRGWRADTYQVRPPGGGNHWHMRIGDLYVDGAYHQFFDRLASDAPDSPGAIFVGTRAALVAELDQLSRQHDATYVAGEDNVARWWTGVVSYRGADHDKRFDEKPVWPAAQ